MSVWIGYLQWIRSNGFGEPEDPVLRPMDTFECKDAILDLSDPENPEEPEWPKVDSSWEIRRFWAARNCGADWEISTWSALQALVWTSSAEADFCCYWFEKARAVIEAGFCTRAGLLATQGIRGGQVVKFSNGSKKAEIYSSQRVIAIGYLTALLFMSQ